MRKCDRKNTSVATRVDVLVNVPNCEEISGAIATFVKRGWLPPAVKELLQRKLADAKSVV